MRVIILQERGVPAQFGLSQRSENLYRAYAEYRRERKCKRMDC